MFLVVSVILPGVLMRVYSDRDVVEAVEADAVETEAGIADEA